MKPWRLLLCGVLLFGVGVTLAEEGEDFDSQEEGQVFDPSRTGLLYKRNLYVDGDNVTNVPYYPTQYNDTADIRDWKIYVSHWEQDPPSFVIVYINDDSIYHYKKAEIDLRIRIGQYDRAKNLIEANETVMENIPIQHGINRIPMAIHNYKGDVVHVHLLGVRQKLPISAIDVTPDNNGQ